MPYINFFPVSALQCKPLMHGMELSNSTFKHTHTHTKIHRYHITALVKMNSWLSFHMRILCVPLSDQFTAQ